MDSSIAGKFDYSVLDSLEWSGESHTLSSFLDQFGSSLPQVVKVLQGFCGEACSGTIDSGQILILHSLHEETKILAKNVEETELFIPKDLQVKVEMIPKNSLEESTSVKELLQTFPKYFRALSDIPSHDITSGSMFKIIRQKSHACFECLEIINDGEEREVRLPFSLKGRFQALQDNREFLIDEVYAEEKENLEDDEPVNIHFVKSCLSGISIPGLNVESLYDLGTLRLVGECELETVFATILSSEDGKTLAVFPKDLEITIHSAKTNEHYDSVRRMIKDTQLRTLKRIERLNKLSLYQARNPVRQFSQIELKPPALRNGKARINSARKESIDKGSNSTPALPPRVPLETKHKENPLLKKAAIAGKNNLSQRRPNYKPPDIPHQSQPPLPPKERPHSIKDKEQNLTSGQDLHKTLATGPQGQEGQESDPESPPIPPPRLRRRQKSLGRRKDVNKSALISTCYEQMEGFSGYDQEYEEMDGSWLEQEGTLEEIFSDVTVEGDVEDTTAAADKLNGKEKGTGGEVNGCEVNNDVPSKVKADDQRERVDSMDYENTKELKLDRLKKKRSGKTTPGNDADDQIERSDSVDYENTKELKLTHLKKGIFGKAVSQNDADDQRERSDSMDYENTKELKLDNLRKGFSGKTVPQNDADYQRERVDSLDYENTKELKLDRLKKKRSGKRAPGNDADDQRERSDSVDYELENTPKVKPPGVMKDGETVVSDELLEGIPRTGSVDYENTKELKFVPPGRRTTVSDDISQEIPRKDSLDYENTKELKLKIPSEANGKDGVTKTKQTSTLGQTSQWSLSCSNNTDDINTIEKASAEDESDRPKVRSKLEAITDPSSVEGKTVAKTEQFLKELKLSGEVPLLNDEGTKKESSVEDTKNGASDGIYYTTMAENVADPSYYTAMAANRLLQGDVYEEMSANQNNATYMPMNASYAEDDSIYENDTKGDDSDDMDDYEKVDSLCTPCKKTQLAIGRELDEQHSSDAYEEVDIIQQIESSLDKKRRGDEKMDIPQVKKSIPSRRVRGGGYEEIDPPSNPSSNHLNVVSRERPVSDCYEDVEFSSNASPYYVPVLPPISPVTISKDNSAPPTPPQRRAKKLRKSINGEVKVGDSQDQPEVLSSSPKSCEEIGKRKKEDFEDLESLQVHLAVKASERQMLFEKALLIENKKQPPNPESPKESPETSRKDKVSTAAVNQVADQCVKSRPPAPPPRKPVNYLDVEPTGKPESKLIKRKSPCNYSEIIGKVQAKHSSKEDDMEYIDDIELHYFQKEHMKEKKRKDKMEEKNVHVKDPESNNAKTKETVKDDGEIPSLSKASSESEIGSSVAANVKKFQNGSKDGLQDSKKPVVPKPPPKKPNVKKSSRALSEPMVSQNDARKPVTKSLTLHDSTSRPITSQNSSRDTNNPTTSDHPLPVAKKPILTRKSSEKPAVAKKPLKPTPSLNPPPKPKRTFAMENTHESSKADIENSLNTQKTCRISSNSAVQDTPTPPWNGKNIQAAAPKQSSSEAKATCQRTKPPKPLPRRREPNTS